MVTRPLTGLVLLAIVSGCSAAEEPHTAKSQAPLVGVLAGTDARVGLVLDGDKGVLYVCGGPTTRATLTRWFRGARTSTGLDWTSEDLRVVASPRGAGWGGEVRKSDGTALTFELTPAASGTIAGLYDTTLPEGRAGVVVFQPSSAEPATILGTFKTTAGAFEQVLPVRDVLRTPTGIEVQVTSVKGTFYVQPVAP